MSAIRGKDRCVGTSLLILVCWHWCVSTGVWVLVCGYQPVGTGLCQVSMWVLSIPVAAPDTDCCRLYLTLTLAEVDEGVK